MNRGTHDYSLASDVVRDPDPRSTGSLVNGLRIANQGTGYQYYSGPTPDCDPPDSDNWAVLELINLVERVARKWDQLYNYPIITSMDMSRSAGGPWIDVPGCPGHDQHQKGLEVDVRYIRSDNSSGPVDIIQQPTLYSQSRTQQLVDIIVEFPQVYQLIVHQHASLAPHSKVLVDPNINAHTDHMHVWLNDPDGNN